MFDTFRRHGLAAAPIGKIIMTRRLDLVDGRDGVTVFDFTADRITGPKSWTAIHRDD